MFSWVGRVGLMCEEWDSSIEKSSTSHYRYQNGEENTIQCIYSLGSYYAFYWFIFKLLIQYIKGFSIRKCNLDNSDG